MFHLLKKEGFLACIIVMPSVYSPGNERIYVVDALRGFAVMAIMLLHFLEHFIYNSYPVASSPMMEAANQQFKEVFFFLFAGKSYTIFALLFGFTFAVQYRNQARKGRDFAGRFVWRMCLLAVFACMNAAFFPGGDVLLTFSLAGLLLVPCRRLKTSSLVALSLFFLAQPLEWAYAAVQWMHPGWVPPSLSVAESYASLKSAVDTGNFWVMAWENLTTGQWASLAWGIEAGRLMQAPGLFLLGFVLGRQDFFLQNDGTAVFWTRGLLFSLAGTCAFYVVMCLPGLPGPVAQCLLYRRMGGRVRPAVPAGIFQESDGSAADLRAHEPDQLCFPVRDRLPDFFPVCPGDGSLLRVSGQFCGRLCRHDRTDMVLPLVAGAAPLRGAGRIVAPGDMAGRREGFRSGTPVRNGGRRNDVSRYLRDDF